MARAAPPRTNVRRSIDGVMTASSAATVRHVAEGRDQQRHVVVRVDVGDGDLDVLRVQESALERRQDRRLVVAAYRDDERESERRRVRRIQAREALVLGVGEAIETGRGLFRHRRRAHRAGAGGPARQIGMGAEQRELPRPRCSSHGVAHRGVQRRDVREGPRRPRLLGDPRGILDDAAERVDEGRAVHAFDLGNGDLERRGARGGRRHGPHSGPFFSDWQADHRFGYRQGMRELLPGPRILLGPGPSMADPRVLRAMSTPLLGQFDPEFTAIMNDVTELTRFAFETGNERAFPVSGAGRAALEAAITSIVEPADRVVVGECGRFGLLLIEIAERCGAVVSAVRGSWGSVLEPDPIAAELRRAPTKLVAVVHGETSTGVLQPLDAIARVAHEHGALLMADCVVTLGGCEVAVDRWDVDVAVAGAQKCLSCPSGLSPITYNARAEDAIRRRTRKVVSNYLDLAQLADYWSPARFNHHTAPTAMVYGLREALRAVHDEGLEARFARHRLHGDALRAGLDASGLTLFGKEPREHRLPFLTPVVVPEGVDELRVRRRLVEDFGIEIGAAFGQLQGKVWRIGTMGYSAQRQFVLLCLIALEDVLRREGYRAPAGAGLDAALAHYVSAGATGSRDRTHNLGATGIGRI